MTRTSWWYGVVSITREQFGVGTVYGLDSSRHTLFADSRPGLVHTSLDRALED